MGAGHESPPTLDDRRRGRRARKHASAVRETAALDTASCDHFARWQLERSGGADARAITEGARGGWLSDVMNERLTSLLVTRGCTTVSRAAAWR